METDDLFTKCVMMLVCAGTVACLLSLVSLVVYRVGCWVLVRAIRYSLAARSEIRFEMAKRPREKRARARVRERDRQGELFAAPWKIRSTALRDWEVAEWPKLGPPGEAEYAEKSGAPVAGPGARE